MNQYNEIFDILYEIKDKIDDYQYLRLSNLIGSLYEKAKLLDYPESENTIISSSSSSLSDSSDGTLTDSSDETSTDSIGERLSYVSEGLIFDSIESDDDSLINCDIIFNGQNLY